MLFQSVTVTERMNLPENRDPKDVAENISCCRGSKRKI
jgi:hypothetical protein